MNLEATPVGLTDEERAMLESLVRLPKTEQRLAERARIVLLAAEGRSTRSIAQALGT
jgi:DNA-binding CsgD family transcriptional regulator